ncbi:MAG TPA: hypothetical protein VM308_06785 [Sphingomicrobium sp.]|nr:hypothetical protein [Sphingomicrobium sp.]
MRGPRGGASSASTASGDWLQTMQPLSIVLMVMIIGASFYLWRKGALRSRAALITIAAILMALAYLGFIYKPAYLV